jgi:tRNA dimethylallyltransferase
LKKTLVAVVGPTANGKSAVGVELARRIGGEIVSCDSMQVYRRMPVCTQAPARVVRGVRHHLASFVEPSREYSAARFRKDAEAAIRAIVRRKKTPILVGGTGLYLRALLDGLFEADADRGQDEKFRSRLRIEAEKSGSPALHERLRAVDPASAANIHPNDLRRVIRALEVHHLTGRPMSELKPRRAGLRGEFDCRLFMIERDRAELYRRIDRRVERMMRAGLPAEAARLSKKRLSRTAGMALGLREMKRLRDRELTRAEAVDLLKKNTRHYAKRQLSWFRHEKGVEIVPASAGETDRALALKIAARLKEKA